MLILQNDYSIIVTRLDIGMLSLQGVECYIVFESMSVLVMVS